MIVTCKSYSRARNSTSFFVSVCIKPTKTQMISMFSFQNTPNLVGLGFSCEVSSEFRFKNPDGGGDQVFGLEVEDCYRGLNFRLARLKFHDFIIISFLP